VGRKKAVVVDRRFQNKGFRAQYLRAVRRFHGFLKFFVDFPYRRVGELRGRFRMRGADGLLCRCLAKNAAQSPVLICAFGRLQRADIGQLFQQRWQ